ncbi:MAG: Bax inhibitor-1/YccA family protein [Alphaproteobacteria bacterium]
MAKDYSNQQSVNRTSQATKADVDAGLRAYMLGIYNYMTLGLGITGLTAFGVSQSPELLNLIYTTPLQWVVMLAPLAFVFFFASRLHTMQTSTAQALFWVFSVLMGVSLSYIFIAYTGASITRVFFITAGTFAATSLYGYTTSRDLTSFGSFLFMGLIGIVIASVVNIFLASSALEFAISVIGVLVFTGLTAYDTQRIKHTYHMLGGNKEAAAKFAISGALSLYLDFINLFLMLLRLFGDRR